MFLFNVGVNRGHGGDKGVDLEVDNDGGDDILSKNFIRSGLLCCDCVDAEYGNCGIGTESHDGLGKILEETLEVEPGAHGKDVVCGFESEIGNCAVFDIDEEGEIDSSGVCALLVCIVENAGDDKS